MSRSYVSVELRQQVAAAAQYRCGYCLTAEWIVGYSMGIDHIIPESRGGPTEEENLWLACPLCNGHKGDRTEHEDPLTGRTVPLFDPRRQGWYDHFAWSDGGIRIVGLTAVGRATVLALNLNRKPLVRSRKRWVGVGWHPPSMNQP